MSSKVVRDKVLRFLETNWTRCAVAGAENEIDNPPEDLEPWLSVGYQSFGETVVALGTPNKQCLRETGLVYLNVWVASGRGSNQALELAEEVRKLFRRLELGDGLRFITISPPNTGIPSQVNSSSGNWFAYQVDASYVYDNQS